MSKKSSIYPSSFVHYILIFCWIYLYEYDAYDLLHMHELSFADEVWSVLEIVNQTLVF